MVRSSPFQGGNTGSNPVGSAMLTFKDLEFKPHPLSETDPTAIQAIAEFDNGYGVSVIRGRYFYCNDKTYEVAILKDGSLCYDTPITDDVLGYQTKDQVTKIMKELQTYEKDSKIPSTV